MVKLEREVKTEENPQNISKWKSAWEVTKYFGELGAYFGLIGLGYYVAKEIADMGILGAGFVSLFPLYGKD